MIGQKLHSITRYRQFDLILLKESPETSRSGRLRQFAAPFLILLGRSDKGLYCRHGLPDRNTPPLHHILHIQFDRKRFHQGAFYLAQQLGADILPVYLHGVGHVLPKRDFLLRKGRIDVEVGRRMPVGQSPLLEFTREMRHHYQEHYQQMCEAIENDNYWKPYRKYTETYEA